MLRRLFQQNPRMLVVVGLLLALLLVVGGYLLATRLPGRQANEQPSNGTPTPTTLPASTSLPSGYPLVDTWNGIHLFQSFSYDIHNPEPVAHYYDFVWGVQPTQVAAFHAGNPHIALSYYIPFHRDGGSFTDPELGKNHDLAYWQSIHPDWILYQCDKTTPAFEYGDRNIPLDFSNPDVVAWQIQTYGQPASTAGYDAIAADNVNLHNQFGACGFYRNGQWVQRYSHDDDTQWRADILTWVARMQAALHALKHPLALIPNLGLTPTSLTNTTELQDLEHILSHVDGVLDERGFTNYGDGYITDDAWLQTVHFIQHVQKLGKPYYILNEFKVPSLTHTEMQWAIASYLLCKDHYASLFVTTNYQGNQAYGATKLYNEYQAQVNSPTGEMYMAQNVYWRDYHGGLVVVNPSSTNSYTVTTSASSYVDLYGNHVSQTFTLAPHTGMYLSAG